MGEVLIRKRTIGRLEVEIQAGRIKDLFQTIDSM